MITLACFVPKGVNRGESAGILGRGVAGTVVRGDGVVLVGATRRNVLNGVQS